MAKPGEDGDAAPLLFGSAETDMSSNRTAMSLYRTRLSGQRTLMAIMRAALSMIGFGFTIFKYYQSLVARLGSDLAPALPSRRLGLALVIAGIVLVFFGLINHIAEGAGIREREKRLYQQGLLQGTPIHATSGDTLYAVLLLLVGFGALASMLHSVGWF